MKAFLAACAALCVITIGANIALENAGFSAQDQGTSLGVRLDP